MANITTNTAPAQSWNPFAGFGTAIMNTLTSIGEANSRMREVEYLQSLSDEALAERGLKRDEIVSYVFRELLYV